MKGLEIVRRVSTVLWIVALLAVVGCASGGGGAKPSAPPPPPPPPAAVGAWNLVVETPVGNQESVLTISGTAEALTGALKGEQGETAVNNVAFAGDELTFAVSINAQGQQLDLSFKGTIAGDAITGSFESPFGPIPVTGKRAGG